MHRLVASWFGTGLILRQLRGSDSGSGTVGSIFAGVAAYLLYQVIDLPWQIVAALIVVLASLWSVGPIPEATEDPGWIVIDEAGGVFIALIGLGIWPGAVVAFLVFRAADIFKSFFPGVGAADNAKGSMAVTGDDVVAGLYGLIAGHVVQALV